MKKNTLLLSSIVIISILSLCTNNSVSSLKAQQKATYLYKINPKNAPTNVQLRIKNMEDYIYMSDEDSDAFIHAFEQYYQEQKPGYTISIDYQTTDTNETLYSQLLTGKSEYDLICPSEYMIQKMVREDLLVKLNRPDRDVLLSNYDAYSSPYLRSRFDEITVSDENGNNLKNEDNSLVTLGEYGVGYMWGTLGILFNPHYANYDYNKIIEDAAYWDLLWDSAYNGTISVKDSMRDTYALAVLQVYKDELISLRDRFLSHELSFDEYNHEISEVFNRCDDETIKKVENILGELRNNVFGLEVDSGKADIVSGKIGINFAWSGDAVYSIDLAEEEDKELCYSIPLLGSNLWFDAWVMPKANRTDLQEEAAYMFLDFLSMPENAALNMEYTGYTSFIGGEAVCNLVSDWYDIRSEEMYYEVADDTFASIYWINPNDFSDYDVLTNDDFLTFSHDTLKDDYLLVYFEEDEEGNIIDDSNFNYVYLLDDDENLTNEKKTYGDLLIVDDTDDIQHVDLNYFFNNEFGKESFTTNDDYIFYTDCYYMSFEQFDSDGNVVSNDLSNTVGRQFFCQYPDFDTITRCAVMKDFGDKANNNVLKMWERFKSTSLPLWATILFVSEIAFGIGVVSYFVINKKVKFALRKKRIENNKKS